MEDMVSLASNIPIARHERIYPLTQRSLLAPIPVDPRIELRYNGYTESPELWYLRGIRTTISVVHRM